MVYVEVRAGNGGLLLNLSEGGLALQAAHVLREPHVAVRFRLAKFPNELEAAGEVVWLGAADKRAGIRFTEISATARNAIRDWVAEQSNAASSAETAHIRRQAHARAGVERFAPELRPAAPSDGCGAAEATALLERAKRLVQEGAAELYRARHDSAIAESPLSDAHRPSTPAPSVQKKWSSQNLAESYAAHNESASPAVRRNPPEGQPQPESEPQAEIKLPEIAWWVEPQQPKRRWESAVALIFVFTLTAAFAAGILGLWQPEALLEKIGWLGPASDAETHRNPSVAGPAAGKSAPSQADAATPSHAPANSSPEGETHVSSVTPAGNNSGAPATTGNTQQQPEAAIPPAHSPETPISAPTAPVTGAGKRDSRSSAGPRTAKDSASASSPPRFATGEGLPPLTNRNTVLVRAPEPGSLPMALSLPERTISATAVAAITSRRGIRIPSAPTRGAAMQPERVTIGGVLTSTIALGFPDSDAAQYPGAVTIHAKIGLAGEVTDAKVINGPPRLVAAVLRSVRQWRYQPTFVDGRPVETEDEIRVVFRIGRP